MEVGGQRGARREVVSRALRTADLRIDVARAETRARVRAAYVSTQLALERVEAAAQREALVGKLLEAVRARVAGGASSNVDLELARLERGSAARARIDATLAAADALARLRLLVGLPTAQKLELDGKALPPRLRGVALPDLLARAQAQRAELAALASGVDEIDADIVRLRREAIPSPTLFVEVQRDLPGQIFVGGGLGVPLPVWRRNQGELALARADRLRVQEERTLVERDVALEVERAYQAEAAQREMTQVLDSEVLPAAEIGGHVDDGGLARREIRSVPAAADVARRERRAAPVPGDAGPALGILDRPRSRGGGAMTRCRKDRVIVVVLAAALGAVGALALRGGSSVGAGRAGGCPAGRAGGGETADTRAGGARQEPGQGGGGRAREARRATSRSSARSLSTRTTSRWSARWCRAGSRALAAGVGDKVKRGQVIAEIESSDVGQARAELVSAQARFVAADANLKRETDLAEKKISSSREQELAHAQWVSEQAGVRAAVMRLRAIGLSPADIEEAGKHDLGGRVQMRAPISGTVIERKVTLGQAVERATDAFKIADTTHVWVSLDLYEKDLGRVHVGQEVEMRTDARPGEAFRGRVAFVVPVIDEATRTAKVRLEFPNPDGLLHAGPAGHRADPGRPEAGDATRCWRSRAAPIEQVEGKTVVFVQTGEAFERRSVLLGTSGGDRVEVRKGLDAGERSPSTAHSCSRASSCDEPGTTSSSLPSAGAASCWRSGRRCSLVAAGVGARICRSTPSPT